MTFSPTKYIFLTIAFFLNAFSHSHAQPSNIGIPPITNYSKKLYNAGTQNWDIAQHPNGLLYFANNGGLLEFDGVHWKCYGVSNQTNIRSVAIDKDEKIYVGAQGEFGYFYGDEKGDLIYQSLTPLIKESDKNIADVWGIDILGDKIFIRTRNKILLYHKNSIQAIYSTSKISYSTIINNEYYINSSDNGILKYSKESFNPITASKKFNQKEISGIFQFDTNTLLIATINSGLFLLKDKEIMPWEINDNNVLSESSIYSSTQVNENTFALGTSTKGVFIINKKGQIINHIKRNSGLQNNNILSIFSDEYSNLWLGLNNGIDYIETSSPFSYIQPNSSLQGTGYAIQIHDNKIYFGTSNGVYSKDWKAYYNPIKTQPFKFIPNTGGQVWDLLTFKDDLLLNHHNGTFVIKNNSAIQISDEEGSWLQIAIKDQENLLLSGYYSGLATLEWNNDWKVKSEFFEDWQESSRIMAQDEQGNLWVSHPYKGAFKVNFNEDYTEILKIKQYNSSSGFPSDLLIYVFKIGEEVIFGTDRGVYSYNSETDRFAPNEKWNQLLGERTWVKRLIESPSGDIWFVTEDNVGVLEVTDGGIYKQIKSRSFPQIKNKLVGGFERIYPYDNENVFFAYENGFIHFNPQQIAKDTSFNVHIRQVRLENSLTSIFGGTSVKIDLPVIDYKENALRFSYAASYYSNIEGNQYQYYLEGFDEKWSEWGNHTEKEYTNLNYGTYTFHVKAQNINGHESPVEHFTFKIAPPWYATKVAYSAYTLLFGVFLLLLILIPRKQFEQEKAALQSKQEKNLKETEQKHLLTEQKRKQQISQLEKEKLELKIQAQNKELATNTMHLVQKSEILQKLKEELQKIAKASTDEKIAKELKKVIRKVAADERLDEDWKQFSKHFDQVYGDFLKRLREKHPNLTTKDHKLCAYLRMNLTSKEIAPLLNISVRGVEIARYRLRKRLEIGGEVNLVELMMEL
jgi:ligand-binding sensor domain-containing protein/DNA-binding CsgD family transcriptional regulator